MIRKLTEQDHQQIFPFLQKEASKNLFIIGDIEAFGYERDFQEVWGEFNTEGKIKAVLLRYYRNFIVYAPSEYDAEEFAKIIMSYQDSEISGDGSILQQLEPYISMDIYEKTDMYFAECTRASVNIKNDELLVKGVKRATIDDAKRIVELESKIEEFGNTSSKEDRENSFRRGMETKTARTYYIEENSEMVSAVSATAENSVSAMIVGVCTLPDYRKKGYVSAILSIMMEDLLQEKETLCLFYHNPEAGSIYKRIGFYDIGTWSVIRPK